MNYTRRPSHKTDRPAKRKRIKAAPCTCAQIDRAFRECMRKRGLNEKISQMVGG